MNLLLVDRGVQLYQALVAELHNDPAIGAIHPCESADDALQRPLEGAYGALLINAATMPEAEALHLTREVAQRYPPVRVFVCGLTNAKERAVAFIEAGADAYLRGTQPVQAIVHALRDMLRGYARLCPDVAAAVLRRISRLAGYRVSHSSERGSVNELTPRQREVLGFLRRGMSNAAIADELGIEVGTVKSHVHHLLTKLKVSNRHEAAKLAPEGSSQPMGPPR